MSSPWEISPDEHAVSRVQFIAANPQNGKLTAVAAREILLKSGLPQNILAQIWALSDLDKDGHLDEREFAIAVKLTRNALTGIPLPSQLPPTMLQIFQMGSSMPAMPPPMRQPPMPPMPQFNTAPPAVMQNALRTGFSSGPWKTGRECGNWTVAHQKKLHFAQQFNQLDKERVGWLSGNVARNAMGQSGLPMPTLAHIWNLSDVNKDGRLNVDEFCIAMYLIEMHKEGYALPDTTPNELMQMFLGDRAQTESPHLEPGAPPPQKITTPRTFEDKRRDNYDKGQAELERRRQILQEEENRRRAEIERKEREEWERRERERLEKERRAEEQRRAEEERMRALEEQRLEEERKREELREAQRKEQEKIRMAELEKVRIKEMQAVKEKEAEQSAQRQQRQKTLGFQLQALDEKSIDMNESITQARGKIEEITKEIEGMRGERDEKMKRIQQLHTQHQQLAVKSQELAHALLQLQSANRETTNQLDEIDRTQKRAAETRVLVEKLRVEVEEARARAGTQTALLIKKREVANAIRPGFDSFKTDYNDSLLLLARLQAEVRQKLEENRRLAQQARQPSRDSFTTAQNPFAANHQVASESSSAHGPSNVLPSTTSTGTAKYRAKYEFQGRTEDELSFSEGDIILVFEGHASEPGWLAGQIKDRVGWFPAAFADPLAPINPNITQPIQSASEVATSPSLERITEEEPNVESVSAILQKTNISSITLRSASPPTNVICVCTAQFAWRARNDEDLTFAKGDKIEVIEQQEMKWRGRKTDGSVGWFPKSYVKIDKQAQQPATNGNVPPAYDTPPGDIPASSSQHSIKQRIEQFEQNTSSQPPIYDAPPGDISSIPAYDTPPGDVQTSTSQHSLAEAAWKAPSGSSQPNGEWFVAVFDFDAVEDGDLALKSGDRILVIQQQEQWWKGILNGREGVFPANYVQKAETTSGQSAGCFHGTETAKAIVEFTASAPNQLALQPGDVITVRQKSEQGWWEGETVRNGTIHAGWFPGNYVQVEENTVLSPSGDLAVAQFDYDATQHDELSFKAGDKIFVTSKHDAEWWAGHLQKSPNLSGLFPSAYVQMHVGSFHNDEDLRTTTPSNPSRSIRPLSVVQNSQKLGQLIQELATSEERYLQDLELAIRIFIRPLMKVVPSTETETLTMNWDELAKLSRSILQRLKQGQPPGSTLLSEIGGLQQFIGFCSQQQAAADALEKLLKDPSIQRVYMGCCQNPAARGMSLHTLLLVPLGRITRYPLLLEKMLAESDPQSADLPSLDMALSVTKTILDEINRSINESDNMCLLTWCQSHVRVTVQPALEFAAPTRLLGSRRVLHSGILWKARSGKLLVGILFNDFLLLTTPNETITDPSSFKLTHQSEVLLTMYRHPFFLHQITVIKDEVDSHFTIHNEEDCKLKAASGNSCRHWLTHLSSAIEAAHQRAKPRANSTSRQPIGRLLVEVVNVDSGGVKTSNTHSMLTIRLALHDNVETFQVDPNRGELKQSTQFSFMETSGMLRIALLEPRVFSPDVPIYDEMAIPLQQLIADCSQHRGPIRRTIQLGHDSNNGGNELGKEDSDHSTF